MQLSSSGFKADVRNCEITNVSKRDYKIIIILSEQVSLESTKNYSSSKVTNFETQQHNQIPSIGCPDVPSVHRQ